MNKTSIETTIFAKTVIKKTVIKKTVIEKIDVEKTIIAKIVIEKTVNPKLLLRYIIRQCCLCVFFLAVDRKYDALIFICWKIGIIRN